MAKYNGYLTPHVDTIREMYEHGLGTGEIAAALYTEGVRADATDPKARMTREHHVANLRMMVLWVLQRLRLRTRRKRAR